MYKQWSDLVLNEVQTRNSLSEFMLETHHWILGIATLKSMILGIHGEDGILEKVLH